MADGHDVVFQMPFVHDGVRGIADFLVRIVDPDTGACRYEPVDAKLARDRGEAGPRAAAVLLRRRASRRVTGAEPSACTSGSAPAGSRRSAGRRRSRRTGAACAASWRRCSTRRRPATRPPEPCDHCAVLRVRERVRGAVARSGLARLRRRRPPGRAATLQAGAGVNTLAQLAGRADRSIGLRPERLRPAGQPGRPAGRGPRADPTRAAAVRLLHRAGRRTRRRGRAASSSCPHPTTATCSSTSRATRSGAPTSGCSSCSADRARRRRARGATAPGGRTTWPRRRRRWPSCSSTTWRERRAAHPGMHVYHYNHTERSSLERLATEHGVAELDARPTGRDRGVRRPAARRPQRRAGRAPSATGSSTSSG